MCLNPLNSDTYFLLSSSLRFEVMAICEASASPFFDMFSFQNGAVRDLHTPNSFFLDSSIFAFQECFLTHKFQTQWGPSSTAWSVFSQSLTLDSALLKLSFFYYSPSCQSLIFFREGILLAFAALEKDVQGMLC